MSMMHICTANADRIVGDDGDRIRCHAGAEILLTLTHLDMIDSCWAIAQCRGHPLIHALRRTDGTS